MKIYCKICSNYIAESFLRKAFILGNVSNPPFSFSGEVEKPLRLSLTFPFDVSQKILHNKGINLWEYFIRWVDDQETARTHWYVCENCFKKGTFTPKRGKVVYKESNESNFHYFAKQIFLNFINNHYVDEIVYKNFHLPLSSCFALAEYKIPKVGNPKEFHGEGWFNGDTSFIERIPDIAVFDKDKMRKNTGDELAVVFEADFDHQMDDAKKKFYTQNRILYFEPDLLIMQALFGMTTKGKRILNLEYLNYVEIEDFLKYEKKIMTEIPRLHITRSTNYEFLYGET